MATKVTKKGGAEPNGSINRIEPFLRNPAKKLTKASATAADHLAALESSAADGPTIRVADLNIKTILVKIAGDTPLICHAWSEKAIKQMLGKQMGEATAGKEKKNPDEDYRLSLYHLPGGKYGFPAIAFKNAAVTACTSLGKAVTKVQARQAFHVMGELIEIIGKPTKRQDMVRLNGQTADVRFRGEFQKWECTLTIRYNANVLSADEIVNILNIAGFAVGVGEWRPERNGQYGLFHVASA